MVMTAAELLNAELPAEEPEAAYRRGYNDGFVQAANALERLGFLRSPKAIAEYLLTFWERELLPWQRLATGGDAFDLAPWPVPRCHYCGRREATQLDHVFPRSRGGPSNRDNLVPVCRKCNMEKLDRTPDEWTNRWYERKQR